MPLVPDWVDIAIRIVLTLLAAGVFGYERGTHGKAAGMRTTLLVALAACLAIIQVNVLLPVDGKTYHVNFDDWMFLQDERVMLNRATMSKFGIRLGDITLSFYKRP